MVALVQFTPAQAARISGVNPALQRDWRRRGILPKGDGHARFDALDVAELMALNALADRGGPQLAKMVSRSCAVGILYSALSEPGAWEGQFDLALQWEMEGQDYGLPPGHDVPGEWPIQRRARLLAKRALRTRQHEVEGSPLSACIWWANGSVEFYGSAITALETVDDERMHGAFTIVDNDLLGKVLLRRAGGPLAVIEHADVERRASRHEQAASKATA